MIDLTKMHFFRAGEKLILFFFFTSLFIFTLYLAGNFQYFLDSTQKTLLEITGAMSVFLFVFSVSYGLVLLVSGAGRKKELTGKFVFFIFSFVSAIILFAVSRFILVWAS